MEAGVQQADIEKVTRTRSGVAICPTSAQAADRNDAIPFCPVLYDCMNTDLLTRCSLQKSSIAPKPDPDR